MTISAVPMDTAHWMSPVRPNVLQVVSYYYSHVIDFLDVDIVFTGKDAVLPSTDMTKNYITQFSKLKSMGDEFIIQLSSNLGLSS
jgi:hypothetical protein